MNTNYLYEKKYYAALSSAVMTKDKDQYKLSAVEKYNKQADEINQIIAGDRYENTHTPVPFVKYSFPLITVYPGLLLGIGNTHDAHAGDMETKLGFSLDYATGLPVIPGSTVKGVLRSAFMNHPEYVLGCIYDERVQTSNQLKELEYEIFGDLHHYDLEGKNYCFSDEKDRGLDVFFDAVPVKADQNGQLMGIEYITPHKAEDGMDGLKNPIPLKLLKVRPQVTYLFRFNLKSGILSPEEKISLFKTILTDLGIGAKTNVGYGMMEETDSQDIYYELKNKGVKLAKMPEVQHNGQPDGKKGGICKKCGKPTMINKGTGRPYPLCYKCNNEKMKKA